MFPLAPEKLLFSKYNEIRNESYIFVIKLCRGTRFSLESYSFQSSRKLSFKWEERDPYKQIANLQSQFFFIYNG